MLQCSELTIDFPSSLQECGDENVSKITKATASMGGDLNKSAQNCERDLFRFLRLPLDTSAEILAPVHTPRIFAASSSIPDPARLSPRSTNSFYLILSKDMVWVEVPLLCKDDPSSGRRVMGKLPMVDPHEYIDYLLTTRRVVVSEEDILCLARLFF